MEERSGATPITKDNDQDTQERSRESLVNLCKAFDLLCARKKVEENPARKSRS